MIGFSPYTVPFTSISHKPEFISNIPEKSWEIRVTQKTQQGMKHLYAMKLESCPPFLAKVPSVIQILIAFLGAGVHRIHPVWFARFFVDVLRGSKG